MGRSSNSNSHHSKKGRGNHNTSNKSPYAAAGNLLNQIIEEKKSFKKLVYENKYNSSNKEEGGGGNTTTTTTTLKCSKTTYAQVCQVLRYKTILDQILTKGVPTLKKDIHNFGLLLVLVYELLFGPNQSIRGGGVVKRKILQQESKLRTFLQENKDIQQQLLQHQLDHNKEDDSNNNNRQRRKAYSFPRYARVNTLLTSTERVVQEILSAFNSEEEGEEDNQPDQEVSGIEFYIDPHVPDLLVFPPDLIKQINSSSSSSSSSTERQQQKQKQCIKRMIDHGELILQDKSSCFSALCLVHGYSNNNNTNSCSEKKTNFIDACAAPGNKTQHLAALVGAGGEGSTTTNNGNGGEKKNSKRKKKSKKQSDVATDDATTTTNTNTSSTIYAFDRSEERLNAMSKRMQQLVPSTATATTKNHNNKSSSSSSSSKTGGVRVITQTQDFLKTQPKDYDTVGSLLLDPSCSGSGIYTAPDRWIDNDDDDDDDKKKNTENTTTPNSKRIESLANFQELVLQHAMSFPSVSRIVYSTCSLHDRENEVVVRNVLLRQQKKKQQLDEPKNGIDPKDDDDGTKDDEWRIVAPLCLKHWGRRGRWVSSQQEEEEYALCQDEVKCMIRACDQDETNGFFVCCLERGSSGRSVSADDDTASPVTPSPSSNVRIAPPKGISIYNGQFCDYSNDQWKNSIESKEERGDQEQTKSGQKDNDNKAAGGGGGGGGDAALFDSNNKEEGGKAGSKNEINTAKSSENLLSKKAAKKLAWKKRQMEQKQERIKKKKLKTSIEK